MSNNKLIRLHFLFASARKCSEIMECAAMSVVSVWNSYVLSSGFLVL